MTRFALAALLLACCLGPRATLPPPPDAQPDDELLPTGVNAIACTCSCRLDLDRVPSGLCYVLGAPSTEDGVDVCRGDQTRPVCLPEPLATVGQGRAWCSGLVRDYVEYRIRYAAWECYYPPCRSTADAVRCSCVAAGKDGRVVLSTAERCTRCASGEVCLADE